MKAILYRLENDKNMLQLSGGSHGLENGSSCL